MCGSAEYYRKNKKTKNVIHMCPHCNYTTTGPKITLRHHILAKHTPEEERPFQCHHEGCNRGFAQKIHLDRHMEKVHGVKKKKGKKKKVLYYVLKMGDNTPTSKKTIERMNFYTNNNVLTPKKIKENISMSAFHYDMRNGYIDVKSITEHYIINNASIVCH